MIFPCSLVCNQLVFLMFPDQLFYIQGGGAKNKAPTIPFLL